MNNKKKKIINTSILLVSLIVILLGSMVISSKFNKDVKIDNPDKENNEVAETLGKYTCNKLYWKPVEGAVERTDRNDGADIVCLASATSGNHGRCIKANSCANIKGELCKFYTATRQISSITFQSDTYVNDTCVLNSSSGNTGGSTVGSSNKCEITVTRQNYKEVWKIIDGSTTIQQAGDNTKYTCKNSTCSVQYTSVGDNFEGITGTHGTDEQPRNGTKASKTISCSYPNEKSLNVAAVYAKETTKTCNISVTLEPGEGYQIYDGGTSKATWSNPISSKNNSTNSYNCKTSNCYATITAFADNKVYTGLAGDGNCSTGPRTTDKQLGCNEGTTSVDIRACYSSSSGGGTGSGGTYTPIQEPTVDKNTTVKKEAFFYAKGNEYQGKPIKCGDKIYITECTNDNDPICDVTSINGTSVSNTKIRFSNVTSNEKDTGCYQEIKRYIAKKTSYYTNRELNSGKTDISCGEIVTFKQDITTACVNKSCEVVYNNKTVYVNIDDITSDKPACQNQDETKTCETSKEVTNAKGDVTVSICNNDDTEEKRNNIVKCADGYEVKYKLSNDTCKDNTSDNCHKEYIYTCSAISKPGISASGGVVNSNGKGIINITGTPYGDIPITGYYVSSGDEPTENSNWSTYNAVNNKFSIERTAGTYFIWAMNNKHKISYPVLAKVYDSDLSTTLATFGVKDSSGNDINVNMSSLDGTVGYYETIVDSKYALLSNNLIADSIGGFDKLTTSYELSVNSNKIALYATLTSSDATYVTGYEPRTIDLEYGRNVALIKIVNKDGKERCYTFIINRVDDRNNSNLLKNIKLSRGSIDFDPYVTNYDVTISRFTKKVSVNAELDSATSTFIAGYEPREVEITEDNQSVVLKVISEAGSIRSYVITFNRKGDSEDTSNSTYLSSLTVPGTMLGFDKETYDYTITVPYETENVPIYAFAESETASVTVGNNTGLKVGNSLIQIEVKNNNKTRIYSLHVIRKESGLDISDSAKLGTLSIKNYNLEFSPDKLDYEVKIKREKTLLITATPESNRADIYMYGNNDLTGFSTIRVKVIAENGLTNIYSIDIQKAAYNKKIEIIAASAGIATVVLVGVIIYIKKKHDKKKEYLEG